ncbi:MAG: hypothetical protein LBR55_05015, partial [Bacteroidales bacterium]|nr:hypothetical protein [Bacteroidales bacterium]
MKKFFFIAGLFLATMGANAQITLTVAKNAPRIGDIYNSYFVENTTIADASKSGANQVWDFSAYSGGFLSSTKFLAASEGFFAEDFPGATMVQIEEERNVETYLTTDTGLTLLGVVLEQNGLWFTNINDENTRELLRFPLSYGTVYNETFAGKFLGEGVETVRAGSSKIEADGYGTLKLHYGTFTNVLRIKITNTYSDVFVGFPMPAINYTEELYYWYQDNSRAPLATYSSVLASTSFFATTYFNYLAQEDANPSGIGDILPDGRTITGYYSILGQPLADEPASG